VDVAVTRGQRGSKRVRHRGMIPLIPLTRQERLGGQNIFKGIKGGKEISQRTMSALQSSITTTPVSAASTTYRVDADCAT
jgi:hypothetical protein